MLGYVIRRVLFAIPIALGVSVVCFSLVYLAPGDPLQTMLPPDATAETIAIVKHAYGFDRPIPVQYAIWLWHVLHGDFGRSIASQRAVTLEVFGALRNTAMLALFAAPLSFIVGYGMGALAGCFPGRATDRIVTGAAAMGASLPKYWLGLGPLVIFAVGYMVLPPSGMGASGSGALTVLHS